MGDVNNRFKSDWNRYTIFGKISHTQTELLWPGPTVRQMPNASMQAPIQLHKIHFIRTKNIGKPYIIKISARISLLTSLLLFVLLYNSMWLFLVNQLVYPPLTSPHATIISLICDSSAYKLTYIATDISVRWGDIPERSEGFERLTWRSGWNTHRQPVYCRVCVFENLLLCTPCSLNRSSIIQ